jgi:hypothetical protein
MITTRIHRHLLILRRPTEKHQIFLGEVTFLIGVQLEDIRSGTDQLSHGKYWQPVQQQIGIHPAILQPSHYQDTTQVLNLDINSHNTRVSSGAESHILKSWGNINIIITLNTEYGRDSQFTNTATGGELRANQEIADMVSLFFYFVSGLQGRQAFACPNKSASAAKPTP